MWKIVATLGPRSMITNGFRALHRRAGQMCFGIEHEPWHPMRYSAHRHAIIRHDRNQDLDSFNRYSGRPSWAQAAALG